MNLLRPILLVEDDERDIDLTLKAFQRSQVANAIQVVRNGEEAFSYLRRTGAYATRKAEHPVVVLLDVKMPKMDGLELLGELRKDAQLRLIPVVLLTSSRERQDVREGYRRGANAYVVKPVKFTEFLEAIKYLGAFWTVLNVPPEF
ncbi:MAG: response regulator [Planctomycetota bacterium]|nr:response regulator [Planctomycetota bacterium]